MRFSYDFLFIIVLSYYEYDYCIQKSKDDINLATLLLLIAPVIIGQPLIFFFSVKKNKTKNEKLRFRMVKTRVTTDYDNTMMFSTDEEDEESF